VPVDQMTEMPFKRFGDDYVQALQALAPQAARVIDKRPGNYLHLGLIHKALPNARIIHVQRDPLDTCLSIYAHNFATTHPYSVDLKLLAQAYQQYQTLMDHWRAVLPATTFLEVSYEALVHDPQGQTQRMLEFLELPWDPACLESHLTQRVVLTPSKRQVREPIHTRAVGRASRYSSFLGDLTVLRTSV
jgi:hypothetical protein